MSNPISDPLVENAIVDDLTHVVKLESTPEGVATVTINRPAKRNALDTMGIEGLTEAFETLHGADHVRVVFLTGAGGEFCAGLDLRWMAGAADLPESDNREDAMTLARMLKALHDIPALTVAVVEGVALGAGAGLVAACDMALAVRGASIGFPEVRLGLIPAIVAPFAVNAVGPRAAKVLFATGRRIDADEARRIGLVDEVFDDSAAMAEAQARIATEQAACAPAAVGEAKRLAWEVWGRPIDHHLMEEDARRLARSRAGEEGREGVQAFLARRKPDWAR